MNTNAFKNSPWKLALIKTVFTLHFNKNIPSHFTRERGILLNIKNKKMTTANTLKIPDIKKGLVVTAEEIIRVDALKNYSRINFADGSKMVNAKVLHWFKNLLPTKSFVWVYRSHLVNKNFV